MNSLKPLARRTLKSLLRNGLGVTGRMLPAKAAPRVLCYHGVSDDPPDEWSVHTDQFRRQLELLTNAFRPASLADVVGWHLGTTELPERSVAITFDDGYVDVLTTVAPILAEHGVSATVFIASGLADGRHAAAGYEPTRPLMNWAQVLELCAAGWSVGSHSVDHPTLSRLSNDEVRRQLVDSRDELEQRLGRTVELLAYPYGTESTVSARDRQLAEEVGYRAAFMDTTGVMARRSADPTSTWNLPRSKVLGTDLPVTVHASLRGGMDAWRFVERRSGGAS